MKEIYFFCDESGAKGYADNQEQVKGEFGLFSGYFIPKIYIKEAKEKFSMILNQYNSEGKFHLASLSKKNKKSLRRDIFELFKLHQINFIYDATYVQGFNKDYKRTKQYTEYLKRNRTSTIEVHHRQQKPKLHIELFEGMFAKAIDYCLELYNGADFKLHIVTDEIENTILKKMQERAEEFLNVGAEKTEIIKGYDRENKIVVFREIISQIEFPKEFAFEKFNIEFDLSKNNDEFTIVADILANSLNDYFRQRTGNKQPPLNTKDMIKDFELFDLCYGFSKRDFGDLLYPYPSDFNNKKQIQSKDFQGGIKNAENK